MTKKGLTKKDRRNSGRQTEVIYNPKEMPYERTLWNDWDDWRDGWRMKRSKFKSWKHKSKVKKQYMIHKKGIHGSIA